MGFSYKKTDSKQASSVCGDFYIVWGSPTKRQTVNRLALFVETST